MWWVTFNILVVYKRCWSPYPNSAIVGGAGHHGWNLWVPAHTVHCARVPCQLRNWQFTTFVPDVNLVIWINSNSEKRYGVVKH